jgi:hypothetical protein
MFSAFEFMLCSPAQQPLYSVTWKHSSLFCTTADFLICESYFLDFVHRLFLKNLKFEIDNVSEVVSSSVFR